MFNRDYDNSLLNAAMDAWQWAVDPQGAPRPSIVLDGIVPSPRWRARLRGVGVPRRVIRAIAYRIRRGGQDEWGGP